MLKFNFSVKTRDGQKVDSILIQGRDQPDAERKLVQMYRYCEVISCRIINADNKLTQSADIEDVLSLIARENQN
jgi:hypothetical protein